jgi:hypothetical protein
MSFCEGVLHVSGGMSQFSNLLNSVLTYNTIESTWHEVRFKGHLDLENHRKKSVKVGDVLPISLKG